jgi:hypothetical protein
MKPLYLLLLAAPLFLNLHCKKDAEPEITKDPDPCELYGAHDARCRAQELAKLPAYTEVGAGTFGCLLNGKAFIPSTCCGDFFNPPLPKIRSNYEKANELYFVEVINRVDLKTPYYTVGLNIFFNLNDSLPKNIDIKEPALLNQSDGGGVSHTLTGEYSVQYNTYNPSSGSFIINFVDTINQIISGTFEFNAANETDTITITDGRFDLPYSLQ